MRTISEEQQMVNLETFNELYKPILLDMLKSKDKRTWSTIIDHWETFTLITESFGSCYFWGEVGSGKTVQAAWRMMEWTKRKCLESHGKTNVQWVSGEDLLQEIRNSYNKNSPYTEQDVLNKYIFADLLVVDDLILDKTSSWHYKVLNMVINSRYKRMVPTIYTNNLSLEDVAKILEDDRIPNRIQHDCGNNIFHFTGESKRNI